MTAGPDTPVAAAPAAPPGGISRWTDIGGPVHYLDFGGPADGPVIVCVHGLGGAAVNWMALAPLLTASCRLLAPDLAGHGLTRAGGRGTGVAANRALLHQFMASVAPGPAKSGARSRQLPVSSGATAIQFTAAPPRPCTQTITGPSAGPPKSR